MTRYKDELFHYSTKPSAAQLLRKKKRISAEEDTRTDDEKAPKKKLSRRQMLLQALQKNPTKIGTDTNEPEEDEEDESGQDLSAKRVKGKPRSPLKKASR